MSALSPQMSLTFLLGIDVQAELRAKTGSPHLGATHMAPNMAQPTVQRAIMNRHHQARRSNSSIAPKLEPGSTLSPQSRPTPPSHASSPTSISPGFHNPGVLTPPASDAMHYPPQQQQRMQAPKPQPQHPMQTNPNLIGNTGVLGVQMGGKGPGQGSSAGTGSTPAPAAAYYPSGPFQNHIEQLGKLTRPLLSFISLHRAMFVLD